MPMASDSATPTRSGSAKPSSQPLSHCVRARSSSSAVMGSLASESMAAAMALRAAATSCPGARPAPASSSPGSARSQAKPKVCAASCFSTSRLCRRPPGVSPSTLAIISTAAKSGDGPAGMWYDM